MQAFLSHNKKMGKPTSKLNHQTTKQHYILAIDITFAKTPAAVTDAPAP